MSTHTQHVRHRYLGVPGVTLKIVVKGKEEALNCVSKAKNFSPICGSPGPEGWQFHSGVYRGCHSKVSACGVLHWDKSDVRVDGFFFLAPGSTWGHFLFANKILLS